MPFRARLLPAGTGYRAARGALAGITVGLICLAVGFVRFIIYLASGGRTAGLSTADLRLMAFYVGGFTVAGMLISAAWPMFRGRAGEYAAFALGGSLVGVAIVLGERAAKPTSTSDWIISIAVGAFLGCAFARGWRKGGP